MYNTIALFSVTSTVKNLFHSLSYRFQTYYDINNFAFTGPLDVFSTVSETFTTNRQCVNGIKGLSSKSLKKQAYHLNQLHSKDKHLLSMPLRTYNLSAIFRSFLCVNIVQTPMDYTVQNYLHTFKGLKNKRLKLRYWK